MSARRADAGLSLIEVIVSLAIFAVIGVAGLAVLDTVARTGAQSDDRVERLSEIDRAFLVIRRDLAQIAPSGVTLEGAALAFRRADGDGSVAIRYLADDGAMIRRIDGPAPVDQRLLSRVAATRWRLMDRGRAWHDLWPPQGSDPAARPVAAELTLDLWRDDRTQATTLTRLIVLPEGQGR